jgi:hypothetical protein
MEHQDPAAIALILLYAVLVIGSIGLFIWSVLWAYADAERRGKSGCLVALLVAFLSWPLGLIAWIIFRPTGRNRY